MCRVADEWPKIVQGGDTSRLADRMVLVSDRRASVFVAFDDESTCCRHWAGLGQRIERITALRL